LRDTWAKIEKHRRSTAKMPMNEDHADFPLTDSYRDACGRERRFRIRAEKASPGWVLTAEEIDPMDFGYEFQAFAETSPFGALGELRSKIKKGLATRYLDPVQETPALLHDRLCGRITWDRSTDGMVLVVDGRPISMDHLWSILEQHEGWQFEMMIKDPCE
jgi:hypothetical protein